MFTHITDDTTEARRVIDDIMAPMIRRPADDLAARLLVGPPDLCAERLRLYAEAGLQRVCIWPIADDLRQLELVARKVAPALK